MKKTLLFLSLGAVGYALYSRYRSDISEFINANADLTDEAPEMNTSETSAGNVIASANKPKRAKAYQEQAFAPQIEAQVARGEGLTDEGRTGIND